MKKSRTKRFLTLLVFSICFLFLFKPDISYAYSGSSYTTDSSLAAKLDNLFSGVQLFKNNTSSYGIGSKIYTYDKATYSWTGGSGSECYAYANAAYYYLFGDSPNHGDGSYSHSKVISGVKSLSNISYDKLSSKGVGCGAYIRSTNNSSGTYNGDTGHSMIILTYNASGITYLHAAGSERVVQITTESWSNFNNNRLSGQGYYVSHIVQPNTTAGATTNTEANVILQGTSRIVQTDGYSCGGAASLVILRYAGYDSALQQNGISGSSADKLYRQKYGSSTGMTDSQLKKGLHSYLPSGTYAEASYSISYSSMLTTVKNSLTLGCPVISSVNWYSYDHWVLIYGIEYDSNGTPYFLFHDSVSSNKYGGRCTAQTFYNTASILGDSSTRLVIYGTKKFPNIEVDPVIKPAETLEFQNVKYPATYKIRTDYGWDIDTGVLVSDVNLTSIRSILKRNSGNTVIDDTGDVAISGNTYSIKNLESVKQYGIRFDKITPAGQYTWTLIGKDSNGRELTLAMSINAVSSGSTSTSTASISYTCTTHSYGAWTVTTAATCTASGVETRACSKCGTSETRSIAALGHDFGAWTVTTAATCTESGVETRVCSRDSSHTETRTISALGHVPGEWVIVTNPSSVPGRREQRCVRCNELLAWESIPAVTYTVTYSSGTTDYVSNLPASQIKTQDIDLSLSDMVPVREGYTFIYWVTPSGTYEPGSVYQENADVVLSAIWNENGSEMSAGAGQTISNGDYYICSAVREKIILDAVDTVVPAVDGTDVRLCDYGSSAFGYWDAWTLTYLGNGFYSITQPGTKMALTVESSSVRPRTNIHVKTYTGSTGQQWSIEQSEYGYRLKARCSGLSADITGGVDYIQNNTNVQQWNDNEGVYAQNQSWKFVLCGGKCGDHLTWKLDGATLTVSGTGAMYDYTNLSDPWRTSAPWGNSRVESALVEEGVTSIGNYAFYFCSNMATVSLPSTLKSIGSSSFQYCESLTTFDIPAGTESIGGTAFAQCSSLQQVTIPASVNQIYSAAFAFCPNLNDVIIASGNPYFKKDNGAIIRIPDHRLIYYPISAMASEYIVPNDVTTIDYLAFGNVAALKSITISSSITSIDKYAFENTGIEEIRCFDESAAYAFAVEHGIPVVFLDMPDDFKFKVPAGTLIIDEEAFSGVAAKRVKLPEGVTAIRRMAFANCPNLVGIYIPEDCTSIATNAFSGCANLTIYGQSGSYAEFYAGKHGFAFKAVD